MVHSILVKGVKPDKYNQSTLVAEIQQFEAKWQCLIWGASANQTWTVSGESLIQVATGIKNKYRKWFTC